MAQMSEDLLSHMNKLFSYVLLCVSVWLMLLRMSLSHISGLTLELDLCDFLFIGDNYSMSVQPNYTLLEIVT